MPYRVYYDDGTTEDNTISQPWRVVCLAQPREKTGREIVHGYPYYVCDNGVWRGLDDATSLIQLLMYRLNSISAVAMGIWVGEETFTDIIRHAREDDGLPRRSNDDNDRADPRAPRHVG